MLIQQLMEAKFDQEKHEADKQECQDDLVSILKSLGETPKVKSGLGFNHIIKGQIVESISVLPKLVKAALKNGWTERRVDTGDLNPQFTKKNSYFSIGLSYKWY